MSGDLPTDFGFPIAVHAHEPDTVHVVPITSDSHHFPPEGKLRVYRSRTGGDEWEPLTRGLPQQHCYVNVLRDAMAVDSLDDCGIYFGTTGGQVYASDDAGDSGSRSSGTARRAVRRGPDAVMDLGGAARAPAGARGRWRGGRAARPGPVTQRLCSTRRRRGPVLRGTIRDHRSGKRRAFVRFFACQQDLSHQPPMSRCGRSSLAARNRT